LGGIPLRATPAPGDGAVSGSSPGSSVGKFDSIFFDDGIGEDVVCERLDIFLRLIACDALSNCDIEAFALADIGDFAVAQTVQRVANGLALGIEYSGLEENEDSCFHQKHDYRTRFRFRRARARPTIAIPTVADVIGSGVAVMLAPRICTITSCAPTCVSA